MDNRKVLADFNPMEQEILQVYWSDHCRHTTFNTRITDIKIDAGSPEFKERVTGSLKAYEKQRELVHGGRLSQKPITLMDLATIGVKYLKAGGELENHVDDKIEYNACTILTGINGRDYRISFKNETHNSPTEVSPYNGAATALGGAIRDILASRARPYQAMRITGCADPTSPRTMPGKLPQKQITTEAAAGFAAYGREAGLTAGKVHEIYHENYVAKRLEAGFIAGVAAKDEIRIEQPAAGDIVVLIGARTNRDGIGAATASSATQDENSIKSEGSLVPTGYPEIGRRIMELYGNPKFLKLVKKCNDFGAGGVSVAVGELADGLDIYLERVPLKDESMTPLEIAISEAQERMAVAIAQEDLEELLRLCAENNLEAAHIADVTDTGFMNMFYRGEKLVSFSRDFLDNAVAAPTQDIVIKSPKMDENPFCGKKYNSFREMALGVMSSLENCSQQGLGQIFVQTNDHTVLPPFDGKTSKTPTQGSVMLVPVKGNTSRVTIAAHGYDPYVARWSPYYGGIAARLDSMAKILALGGDYKNIFLSDQEYYASPVTPEKFGHPFAALLGANDVSRAFGVAAIGGKDSMSGSYKDIDVPPTFISFAIAAADIKTVQSQAFKKAGSTVGIIEVTKTDGLPVGFDAIREKWDYFIAGRDAGNIVTARAIGAGGIIGEICNACFGNEIGFRFNDDVALQSLNNKSYGSLLVEIKDGVEPDSSFVRPIGKTLAEKAIILGEEKAGLDDILRASESRLAPIFPISGATGEQHN
jgi:phosphoribosylformylglycinamidine synthase